jgi:hypothetical protein
MSPLPMDTPLAELGLAPEELRQLSPAVQKLTKADLVAAAEGEITQSFEVLTVRDLNSITQVYVARAKGVEVTGVAAANGCCCCTIACCCSCCAASVDAEHVTVAA